MTINYPFPLIASTATDINTSGTRLEQLLSDMDSMVRTRLAAVWQGSGAESYQIMAQRWNSTAADVRLALANLASATEQAGTNMGHTDRINRGRFAGGA